MPISIDLPAATSSQNGYLKSSDWTIFNNKQSANGELTGLSAIALNGIVQRTGSGTYTTLGVSAPLSVTAGNITIPQATSTVSGYLSDTDWTTFNNKAPAAGSASITTVGTVTSGTWNGNTLTVPYGGTGLTSGSAGGVPYFASSTSMASTAAGTSGQVLTSNGAGAPTWQTPALSQWAVSGNDISNINSGNVGIGTSSPIDPLHVTSSGDTKIRVSSSSAGGASPGINLYGRSSGADTGPASIYAGWASDLVLKPGNNQPLTLRDGTNTTRLQIGSLGDVTINGLTAKTSGRLGIGTSSPSTDFEVNGQVKITDGNQASGKVLTSDANGLATWQTLPAGAGGTVTSVSVTSANGFAGTVATGATTPAISISTSITGMLKGNGTAISAAGASDIASTLGSQTAKTFYAAPNGSAGTPSFRSIASSDLPVGLADGNILQNTQGSSLTTNNILITNATGVQQLNSPASGVLTSSGTVPSWSASLPATMGGTGLTSFTIGDLLYASSTSAMSKLGAGANGYVLTSNGPGAAPSWQAASTGVTGSGTANYLPKFTSGTAIGNSSIYDSGTSVGIGTSGPWSPLTVWNTTTNSAVSIGRSANSNSAILAYEPFGSKSASNVVWLSGLPAGGGDFRIASWDGTTGTDRLTITTAGNVGIGLTTPSSNAKLHVSQGPVFVGASPSASSTDGLVLNSTYGTSELSLLNSVSGNSQVADGLSLQLAGSNAVMNLKEVGDFIWQGPSAAEYMRIKSSGNVGIGTNSPGSALDVNGTIRTDSICDRTGANCRTIASDAPVKKWVVKSAGYAAVQGDRIGVDTSAGSVTIKLPASPSVGDQVELLDALGSFDTNNLTVSRNGSNIMGLAEDMVVSTKNISFGLVYMGATAGWRIF